MIFYNINISNKNDIFYAKCHEFKNLIINSLSQDQSFWLICEEVNSHIQYLIQERMEIPYGREKIFSPSPNNTDCAYILNLNIGLKIELSNLLLSRNIEISAFEEMISTLSSEMNDESVKGLLNIYYHSTIQDISEAFRILDKTVLCQLKDSSNCLEGIPKKEIAI